MNPYSACALAFCFVLSNTTLLLSGTGGGPFVSGILRNSSTHEAITGMIRLQDGRLAVCGWTWSSTPWGHVPRSPREHGGSQDAFIAIISRDLQEVDAFTFFGGPQNDSATGITVDGNGTIIVIGTTQSSTFSTNATGFARQYSENVDGFLVAFTKDLQEVNHASYITGNRDEVPLDVEVDELNTVYICGATTSSAGFPVSSALDRQFDGGSDGFLMRVSQSGSTILYSTYFGADGDDRFNALDVDASGVIAIAATTTSYAFPTYPKPSFTWPLSTDTPFDETYNGGGTDAALVLMNRDGSRVIASTFYGGSGADDGTGVIIGNSDIMLIGTTTSPNLPITGGTQAHLAGGKDVMLARFNRTAQHVQGSTYFGGSKDETIEGACAYVNGQLAVWGRSSSFDLPRTISGARLEPVGQEDAFLAVLGIGSVRFATMIGGSQGDSAHCAVVEPDGGVIVGGSTLSPAIHVESEILENSGGLDAFMIRFQPGTIDVTAPIGGETYCSSQPIRTAWTATEMLPSDKFNVEWSSDRIVWSTVSDTIESRQFSWYPPDSLAGTSGWLRVRSGRYHTSTIDKMIRIERLVSIEQDLPPNIRICRDRDTLLQVSSTALDAKYQWRKNLIPIGGATGNALLVRGNASTTDARYDVIVTASCGQSVISTACTVSPVDPIMVLQQPRDTTLLPGESLRLFVNVRGIDVTYQWQHESLNIEGATSALLSIPNVTKAHAGKYRCIVSGNCEEYSTDVAQVVVAEITGVKEDAAVSLSIYPNPTLGVTTIRYSTDVDKLPKPDPVPLQVISAFGERVPVSFVEAGLGYITIDLSHVAPGPYLVHFGVSAAMVMTLP